MSILSREQVEFYEENGYLIVRQLVQPKMVAELRSALLDIVGGKEDGVRRKLQASYQDGSKVTQFHTVWKTNPAFKDYMDTSKLGEAAAQLMRTNEVRLFYDQLIYKEPKIGGPVPCHQDYDYWHHLSSTDMVTAWTALGKVTPENGGMYMIPGSHKWGLVKCMDFRILTNSDPEFLINQCLDEDQQRTVKRVPLVLEAGDVSFHHCLTIHCSYPNTSDTIRLGYIHHYFPSETRYIAANDIQKHHEVSVPDGALVRGDQFPLIYAQN